LLFFIIIFLINFLILSLIVLFHLIFILDLILILLIAMCVCFFGWLRILLHDFFEFVFYEGNPGHGFWKLVWFNFSFFNWFFFHFHSSTLSCWVFIFAILVAFLSMILSQSCISGHELVELTQVEYFFLFQFCLSFFYSISFIWGYFDHITKPQIWHADSSQVFYPILKLIFFNSSFSVWFASN